VRTASPADPRRSIGSVAGETSGRRVVRLITGVAFAISGRAEAGRRCGSLSRASPSARRAPAGCGDGRRYRHLRHRSGRVDPEPDPRSAAADREHLPGLGRRSASPRLSRLAVAMGVTGLEPGSRWSMSQCSGHASCPEHWPPIASNALPVCCGSDGGLGRHRSADHGRENSPRPTDHTRTEPEPDLSGLRR
jgi:hypothetical protein